jgi:hypothetical protein
VAVATYVNDENEDYHGHKLHCQYRTTETWVKRAEGWRLLQAQILAMREDPPPVALSADLRRQYVGQYALTPEIGYEIRIKGDGLEGQQTGKAEELPPRPDAVRAGKPRLCSCDTAGRITARRSGEAWDLFEADPPSSGSLPRPATRSRSFREAAARRTGPCLLAASQLLQEISALRAGDGTGQRGLRPSASASARPAADPTPCRQRPLD